MTRYETQERSISLFSPSDHCYIRLYFLFELFYICRLIFWSFFVHSLGYCRLRMNVIIMPIAKRIGSHYKPVMSNAG